MVLSHLPSYSILMLVLIKILGQMLSNAAPVGLKLPARDTRNILAALLNIYHPHLISYQGNLTRL
jgi:hypothetical protein